MPLFGPARRAELPDCLHLLAAVFGAHFVVVEGVAMAAALPRLARPQDDFSRVREGSTAQIGRGIRLFPNDVIQQPEAVLSQRHPDARINMQRARDPDRARWSEDSKCLCCPGQMELVVGL